jgi:lycopene cyclase domain-containing protein
MMSFTYLAIDFFTIIIPFLFSFHPKLNFHKTWAVFFPAMLITGIAFLAWDAWFTSLGVWGFNQRYLTGVMIGNLPLEEILFFICIPYACVFTFHCLRLFYPAELPLKTESIITWSLVAGLFVTGIVYYERIYTSCTFLSLAVVLLLAKYWMKIKWLGKFYLIYGILLLPFLVVNGILTGTGLDEPVVWYSSAEIIGLRLLTIPFEDIFYGMELVLINLLFYHWLKNRRQAKHRAAHNQIV